MAQGGITMPAPFVKFTLTHKTNETRSKRPIYIDVNTIIQIYMGPSGTTFIMVLNGQTTEEFSIQETPEEAIQRIHAIYTGQIAPIPDEENICSPSLDPLFPSSINLI